MEQGLDFMKRIMVEAYDFTSAQPNYSHKILALLLLEGYVDVITSNWDTCIEDSLGSDEGISVITSHGESQEIQRDALKKVHGCVTRPDTIRVTTEELRTTPPWARYLVKQRVASRSIVFVGVNDVAPYIRSCVEEIARDEGDEALRNILLVNPDERTVHADSQWACLLPDIQPEQHLCTTADDFFDVLAALCVTSGLE